MLILTHISKTYESKTNTTTALKDINLELPNKGLISIIGKSGCGKTTLLNLIGLIDSPTTGNIRLNNLEFHGDNDDFIRNQIVSSVLQEDLFFEELSVDENVELGLKIQGSRDSHVKDQWYQHVGLESKRSVYPKELSAGQKQRITFVRSLSREFQILLADEPTANLDDKTELLIFQILKRISKDKLVLLVTHNRSNATFFSDRVIELNDGEVIYDVTNSASEQSSIEIEDNIVHVAENLQSRVEDWDLIKKLVLEKKEVHLRLFENSHPIKKEVATEFVPNEFIPTRVTLPFSLIRYLVMNMIQNQKLKFFVTSIFFSLILLLISFLCYFASFNVNKMTWNAFQTNDINMVNYVYIEEDQPASINTNQIQEIESISGNRVRILSNFEEDFLISEIPSNINFSFFERPDSFYIKGLSLIGEDDVTIIQGDFPSVNQILITDYTADRLLTANEEWTDYSDLIGWQIEYNQYRFMISGIIETDQDRFAELKNELEVSSALAKEFDDQCNDIYQRFYVSNDLISIYLNNPSVDLVIDGGYNEIHLLKTTDEFVASNILIDFQTFDHPYDGIYISQNMYVDMIQNESFGTNNPYVYIKNNIYDVKGVINDDLGDQNYYVYADNNMYQKIIANYYSADEILVDVSNEETVQYLQENHFEHQTYISGQINNVVQVVAILRDLVTKLIALIAFVLVLAFLFTQRSLMISNQKRWSLLRVMGMDRRSFSYKMLLYQWVLSGSILLIELILFGIATYAINHYVATSLDLQMNIITFEPLYVVVIVLIFGLLASGISYLMTRGIISKNIVTLFKGQ